jgi:hypothetical protein
VYVGVWVLVEFMLQNLLFADCTKKMLAKPCGRS